MIAAAIVLGFLLGVLFIMVPAIIYAIGALTNGACKKDVDELPKLLP